MLAWFDPPQPHQETLSLPLYAAHFGLHRAPFAITPDPDYLYLSPAHEEALAHLLYGISEDGGFVQLTGEIGTGKTTLIRALLAQHAPAVDTALCLNPRQSPEEFVATLCDELGVQRPAEHSRLKPLVDALNRHLLATYSAGRRTVVIIDEAQALSSEVLEQVRLLTNLETDRHKLLRIILVGQPELRQTLSRPALRQLAQRITARYHLNPLNRPQTHEYIRHRLRVAGAWPDLFTPAACRLIYRQSGGIPRLINIFCDRALLGGYSEQHSRIGWRIARRAIREVLCEGYRPGMLSRRWLSITTVSLGIGLIIIGLSLPYLPLVPVPATEPVATRPPLTPEPISNTPSPARPEPWVAASDPERSLRQLLSLWQLDPELAGQADLCVAIQAQGLRCLEGRHSWAALQRYNRPAVLTLRSSAGEYRQVLLRALHDEQAWLQDHEQPIDRHALQQSWTGQVLLLWRPPIVSELLRLGSEGDDVRWLRQQLARLNDHPPLAAATLFDAELEQHVRRFQQRHGLDVDGLVGSQTLLVLTGLLPEPDTPTLMPKRLDSTDST